LSMMVSPEAVVAASNRFSVAPTEGYSSTTRAPIRPSARPWIVPWRSSKVAPSA
jgi:hypothetical protein